MKTFPFLLRKHGMTTLEITVNNGTYKLLSYINV